MALDTQTVGSPGWYMRVLWTALIDPKRRERLAWLERFRRGEPDVVRGRTERLRAAYAQFTSLSQSNFADLIVSARTNRMSVRSIRTSLASDDQGDQQAWSIWTANRMDVLQTNLYRMLCTFDEAYLACQSPERDGQEPVITVESPWQMITMQDPLRPLDSVAGLKVFFDPMTQTDYVMLWLSGKVTQSGQGEKWVASRQRKITPAHIGMLASFDLMPVGVSLPEGGFLWDPDQVEGALNPESLGDGYSGLTSERYPLAELPIRRVCRHTDQPTGVFETHRNLINAISHTTLQALVIATFQAFRQRALKAGADAPPIPDEDENGQPVNFNELFEADPGALWELPPGYDLWESQPPDLANGVIALSRKLILDLAATSKTPFPMFSPDSANQSANGASLYREGLTFDVEELQRVAGVGIAGIFGVAFQLKGDADRGNESAIIVDWAPADRYSILESAQADAVSSLPAPQKWARFYGMSPAEVAIAQAQATQEAFLAATLAPKPPAAPKPPELVNSSDAAATGD